MNELYCNDCGYVLTVTEQDKEEFANSFQIVCPGCNRGEYLDYSVTWKTRIVNSTLEHLEQTDKENSTRVRCIIKNMSEKE